MSHRIVHKHLAVLFPGKSLMAEVERCPPLDDHFMLLELGGDNNLTTLHPGTNREVANREWSVLAYGSHCGVVKEAVKLSAACEGGGMRLSGRRKTSPEDYIRQTRKALAAPVAFDDLIGLGIGVVAEFTDEEAQATIEASAVRALQSHAKPVERDGRKTWRLYPLCAAKDAALLMLCGPWLPGPVWNTAVAYGPRFPCEGPGLFNRLSNRLA